VMPARSDRTGRSPPVRDGVSLTMWARARRMAFPRPCETAKTRRIRECQEEQSIGAWRSLVAHLHGVQGVPSSNLGAPINKISMLSGWSSGKSHIQGPLQGPSLPSQTPRA
jgi:hypothetical protein